MQQQATYTTAETNAVLLAGGLDIELTADGHIATCQPRINKRSFMATVSAVNNILMANKQYDAQGLLNSALVKAQLNAFYGADLEDAFKVITLASIKAVLMDLTPMNNHAQSITQIADALIELVTN